MKKVRVLIIEDSDVVRTLLEHIIGGDPRLEIAGSAASAEAGLDLLPRVAPDVVSLDIRLPGMDGFEATRQIMRDHPTPIVVCSASVEAEDLKITMNALRAGALAVVEKPVGVTRADYDRIARTLCTQLAIMSEVKVVRQRHSPEDVRRLVKAGVAAVPARPIPPRPVVPRDVAPRILAIGASTGGPNATVQVLKDIGRDLPVPVLLVQHIIPSFLEGFVSWLDSITPLRAVVAHDNDIPAAGTIYVAPADRHLRFDTNRLRLTSEPPVSLQRPSATLMFESVARCAGPAGIGILLTGMGDDGADGLLAMRRAGAYTIAEHESTAVVYGMPKAAVDRGAACEALPLQEIGLRVLDLCSVAERS